MTSAGKNLSCMDLDGKHITRGQRMYMITLQAFFGLYLKGFLENDPVLRQSIEQLSREITEACRKGVKERIQRAHQRSVNAMNSSEVIRKMSEYDNKNKDSPLFEITCHYMRMIMVMLSFIKAVRTEDWQLHLLSLELFTKYSFANDKINFARMIAVYLAEMQP